MEIWKMQGLHLLISKAHRAAENARPHEACTAAAEQNATTRSSRQQAWLFKLTAGEERSEQQHLETEAGECELELEAHRAGVDAYISSSNAGSETWTVQKALSSQFALSALRQLPGAAGRCPSQPGGGTGWAAGGPCAAGLGPDHCSDGKLGFWGISEKYQSQ